MKAAYLEEVFLKRGRDSPQMQSGTDETLPPDPAASPPLDYAHPQTDRKRNEPLGWLILLAGICLMLVAALLAFLARGHFERGASSYEGWGPGAYVYGIYFTEFMFAVGVTGLASALLCIGIRRVRDGT
jgi:hypothetical protein